MEIAGKVALVTGAGSGIGRATALALAREGAVVAVADLDPAGAEETVRQIAAAGGRAEFVLADVSTPDGVQAMFDEVEARLGGVDIVHNNAGIMTADTPGWPDTPLEKLHLVVSVNTSGVIMGTGAAVQALSRRGGGAVINTASIAGLAPMPFDPIYSATKAAVIMFTRGCARLAETHNVRVNAVLPGMVDTPIIAKTGDGVTPAKWLQPAIDTTPMLKPEDIAAAVVDFARDDSAAGTTRVVDHPGGYPADATLGIDR